MEYNLISNVESCYIDLPPLLYYSHLPAIIISLFFGIFVYFKSGRSLLGKILLLISISFSLWAICNLIVWITVDSITYSFFWSFFEILSVLFYFLILYFGYVFIEEKDISFRMKFIFVVLLLPIIVLSSTNYYLIGFNATICDAIMNDKFLYYVYALKLVVFFGSLVLLFSKYKKYQKDVVKRKKIILIGAGLMFLLFSFLITQYFGDLVFTGYYDLEFYGLFGMTFFMGVLAFMIVKFKAFNIKLIGAQALVAALILLIGSQFFFIKTTINFILTGVTFILAVGFGWFIVKSVKEEIKRKEELQKISDSLVVTNDRLRELDNAKSEFISIASHQLRTPLTAIKGYTSLLLEGSYGKVSPAVQDVLDKVYTINNRLVELVENLLNISRIEAGRIQYNFEMVWLEPLVKELVDMFTVAAKNKNLKLTFKLPEQMLPKMTIDPNKIKEVVSNLIDNALKYTKKGEIIVSVEAKEASARIIVADTGMGISRDDKVKLFEKFIRSKETASMFVSGSGLGLYIGKSFVEAHGGKVWAESEGIGKGSRFIVELPFLNPNLKIGISEQSSMLGRGK